MIPCTREEIQEDIPICLEILGQMEEEDSAGLVFRNIPELRLIFSNFDKFFHLYEVSPKFFMKKVLENTDIDHTNKEIVFKIHYSESSIRIMYTLLIIGIKDHFLRMPMKILFSDVLRCQLEQNQPGDKIVTLRSPEISVRKELLEKCFRFREINLLSSLREKLLEGDCTMRTITFIFTDKQIDVNLQSCFLFDSWFNIQTRNIMIEQGEVVLDIKCEYSEQVSNALISWFSSGRIKEKLTQEQILCLLEMSDMCMMDELNTTLRHMYYRKTSPLLDFGITMEVEHLVRHIYMLKFYSKNDDSKLYLLALKDGEQYCINRYSSFNFLSKIFDNIRERAFELGDIIQEEIMNGGSVIEMRRMIDTLHDYETGQDNITAIGFYKSYIPYSILNFKTEYKRIMEELS